ncbi:hypothetical protein CPC16_000054 [Podila verticillata]|nr:hypothetical protein CPC16_000054 [Podila verticillata]
MKITIIGTGYVGLVTGACLAETGNHVFCIDIAAHKIDLLNNGGVPIYEPGLREMLERNRAAGRIHFSTDLAAGVAHGDILFIAVGTPPDEDGSADLQYVLAAARNIGQHMHGFKVIVNKSTVPVGTAQRVQHAIAVELAERAVEYPFSVVSNPEFLKEGAALDDFMRPDRIVFGCENDQNGLRAADMMKSLYAPFNRDHERLLQMDVRSAEMTKYAANAMLATRISFMNELANLAECIGVDIDAVRAGIGADPRIVVGDVMLDRYWFGDTTRISPEAPVPVVHVQHCEERLGGAANVARNIAALGAQANLIGVIGDDEAGRQLLKLLAESSVGAYLEQDDARLTTVKLRIVSLLLSDYGKGYLTTHVAEMIAAARAAGKPVLVDPKGDDWTPYRGASLITPNRTEFRRGGYRDRYLGGAASRARAAG